MSALPNPSTKRQTLTAGRRAVAVLCVPFLAVTALAAASSAQAVSPSVLVNEVYGGGGNSGATWRSDFVELANPTSTAVDVTGWTVRYFSAAGTTPSGTPTVLSGSIAPLHTFLVQESTGAGGTTDLPTPDATGTLTMSASSGRIELLDAAGTLVDQVGYGSSSTFEGTGAAPSLSNTTSDSRISPCVDTDNNSADFAAGQPSPQSSSAAPFECAVTPPVSEPETIHQIQGAAHLSPFAGQPVNGVVGVVTAEVSGGFWMQDPTPDADPATSEGIYVYTRSAPTVAVGDEVTVDGSVSEYRPGGSGGNDNLTTTEIVSPVVTVDSSGNPLPAPVVIGIDRIAPQQSVYAGDPGSVEYPSAAFDPTTNAIDFYESMEGMRVAVQDAQVVGPTASFGEIPVIPGQHVHALRSEAGGVVYSGYDHPNAMRIQLDDAIIGRAAMPDASVGDTLAGLTVGVVDYSFANFKLEVTAPPTVVSGGLQREVASRQKGGELSVASFNVENLAPDNPQEKFDRLAGQIVTNLRAPDIIAIEEVQDNSGATNDGVVDSTLTTDKLIAAVLAAGGPAYQARWVNPQDLSDGGQPGGNIRNVFLFRPDRGVHFVDRPGGDATTAATVVTTRRGVHLSVSPGRIDPTNTAWDDSRKPLVGEFRFHGRTVFAVAVHFASKGGDDPLFGRWQQPVRFSEEQRHAQAEVVRAWTDSLLAADPNARLVIAGDVNDFQFSQTADLLVNTLQGSGATALTDLPRTLPAAQQWTYDYEGNSQVLDHILLSRSLATPDREHRGPWRPGQHATASFRYDIVHTNSPFWDQDSDHDPQVVRLTLSR
jgi:hypothetical protein